jgi:hypothetical protein
VLHPLFVVAICFFPDRTLRGVMSNDKFFGCSSTILPGKLSRPLPTYRGTYYLFVFMLSLMLYASLSDALFESRIISTYFPKQNYILATSRLFTFCLLFELALRVIGMFRLFQVVLSYRVVGKLSHALLDI